jgi:hypothetical protein
MTLKDEDIYKHKKSGVYFTLRQETPLTWSLRNKIFFNPNDYPIYPGKFITGLLENNFERVSQ